MQSNAQSELEILGELARHLNTGGVAGGDHVIHDGREYILVNVRWKLPLGNYAEAREALLKIIDNRKTRSGPLAATTAG
jgi:hypothetical protein